MGNNLQGLEEEGNDLGLRTVTCTFEERQLVNFEGVEEREQAQGLTLARITSKV